MPRILSQQLLTSMLLAFTLSACQGINSRTNTALTQSISQQLPIDCSTDIRRFREQAAREGVADAGSPALDHFPLLHSNRFLHAISHSVSSSSEIQQWTNRLVELALTSRISENKNLDAPWSDSALQALAVCSREFANAPENEQGRATLLAKIQQSEFPAHYRNTRQLLGTLTILRPFLKQRILALHRDEKEWFAEEKPFKRSITYEIDATETKLTADETNNWMRAAYSSNEIALPLLDDTQLQALFAKHAPRLNIEIRQDNDRIGTPQWVDDVVKIRTDNPGAYTLTSMTQFEGRNLLQLNYVFWFPQRKPKTLIDLYSGNVDSVIWRVTLDEDGQVLLYDSIHSCGCYHKYFLASDSISTKEQATSKEPANIFRLDAGVANNRLTLAITANEHYIVGVDSQSQNNQKESTSYALKPYTELQNLGTESQSLFDEQGLIAGSERLERFTLWPTGILSVGAMRQWGTHATGFIEEQHFDDANLLDNYFETIP